MTTVGWPRESAIRSRGRAPWPDRRPTPDIIDRVSRLPETTIVVFDGFDDLDAIGPLEVLSAAGFPVRVAAAPGAPAHVRSAHGLHLAVGELGADVPELAVIPGGGWFRGAGVRDQIKRSLPSLIAEWHAAGAVIGSVCTGAMVLVAAGLLSGRPAVTNHHALADLAAGGAEVQADARVVDDGSVITSGGPAAGLDFALHLVSRFAGAEAARRAATRLEHAPVGLVLVTAASS
jgi:transcriptional regulator GlxA family with amidase domain